VALTDTEVRKAKTKAKAYKLRDSSGLLLWVTPAFGKFWRWTYCFEGKQKLMTLGRYPAVPLAMQEDHFGWFRMDHHPIHLWRTLGGLLW